MHHEWGIILSSVREIPWLIDAGMSCDWSSWAPKILASHMQYVGKGPLRMHGKFPGFFKKMIIISPKCFISKHAFAKQYHGIKPVSNKYNVIYPQTLLNGVDILGYHMVLMCAKPTGSEAEPHSNSTWYASWLRSSSSSSDFIKAVMLSVGWNTGRAASQESWNVREFGKETDGSFQQTHPHLSLLFSFFPFPPVSHFSHHSLLLSFDLITILSPFPLSSSHPPFPLLPIFLPETPSSNIWALIEVFRSIFQTFKSVHM